MVKRLRWGIAGCGWVARDYVAPAIRQSSNSELIAGFDPSPDASLPGIQIERDLSRFLATPGMDAVYVAAPNDAHRPLVEACAAAGRAVVCEKPMATTLGDALAMVVACARAGVRYATAFDQRFHAIHRHLAGLINRGELGTVTAIRIVYACWVGRDWAADNWRIDPARAGGGAMIDLAPHGLDLAAMLLDDDLVQIAALGQTRVQDYAVDDGAMLIARSRRGALVQLHVAYNCPDTLPRRRLEIVGTKAMAVALDSMGQVGGGTLHLIDAEHGGQIEIDVADRDRAPFLAMIEAYSDCLLSGQPFPFGSDRDLRTMELLSRAQRDL